MLLLTIHIIDSIRLLSHPLLLMFRCGYFSCTRWWINREKLNKIKSSFSTNIPVSIFQILTHLLCLDFMFPHVRQKKGRKNGSLVWLFCINTVEKDNILSQMYLPRHCGKCPLPSLKRQKEKLVLIFVFVHFNLNRTKIAFSINYSLTHNQIYVYFFL